MFFNPPTPTARAPSVTINLPDLRVTQHFPTRTRQRHLTYLHAGSRSAVPPHWHATHMEHLRVLKGWLMIRVGASVKLYGPESGTVDIPPYTIHSFARGDHPDATPLWAERRETSSDWAKEDVEFEEWTTPWEGQKELFFRNGMSFFKDNLADAIEGRWTLSLIPALLVRAIWLLNFSARNDNYPLIVGVWLGCGADGKANVFARAVTSIILGVAKMTASLCGWNAWREEYTPVKLRPVAKAM